MAPPTSRLVPKPPPLVRDQGRATSHTAAPPLDDPTQSSDQPLVHHSNERDALSGALTSSATPPIMADPFEVRMRFTSQLQHLNASTTSAQKAAHYALKYRDMDEDLHSCILEQLERVNLNARANIMYFMEALCDMAAREEHTEFIRMMERDILKIIDLVAPDDGSGAANVKVVRKVLAGLQAKRYLNEQTVRELEECIKDRDQIGGMAAMGSPGAVASTRPDVRKDGTPMKASGNIRIDKRQVEQRIEEDRERHKRLREGIWAVGTTDDEEFEKAFEETGPWDDDDEALALEEANERASFAGYHAQAIDDDDE